MASRACLSDEDLGRLCEGDLTVDQRHALDQHLKGCAQCRVRWERVSAGTRHVAATLSGDKETVASTACPTNNVMSEFMSGLLNPGQKETVEKHLAECRTCREQVLHATRISDEHAKEGGLYWARYVGQQVLGLIAHVPEEIERLWAAVHVGPAAPVRSREVIQLAMLRPQAVALAAGTGEGFSEQVLRQEAPPFEFHLAKFGEQLRITVRSLGEGSAYSECLARLRLIEGDVCRWSRDILISAGEGRCSVEPEDVRVLRPEKEHLVVKLEPLVSAEELDGKGSTAYMPILERLLRHRDAAIRGAAIQVISRVVGPSARTLIEPLANDQDEKVRARAQKTLQQLQLR